MSNNSILTNPEALVALRNLERTNRSLAITQNRVSTGLKVTGAIDDASNFAIAQGIRGDVKALGAVVQGLNNAKGIAKRSEEHTSELQSLMRISYAVFCLKKKTNKTKIKKQNTTT